MLSYFAAGCALAPSSVGIASKLLTEAKQLNSDYGQTIVSAAFLDDILAIILLVVLESVGQTDSLEDSVTVTEEEPNITIDPIVIITAFAYCFLFLGFVFLFLFYFFFLL